MRGGEEEQQQATEKIYFAKQIQKNNALEAKIASALYV